MLLFVTFHTIAVEPGAPSNQKACWWAEAVVRCLLILLCWHGHAVGEIFWSPSVPGSCISKSWLVIPRCLRCLQWQSSLIASTRLRCPAVVGHSMRDQSTYHDAMHGHDQPPVNSVYLTDSGSHSSDAEKSPTHDACEASCVGLPDAVRLTQVLSRKFGQWICEARG